MLQRTTRELHTEMRLMNSHINANCANYAPPKRRLADMHFQNELNRHLSYENNYIQLKVHQRPKFIELKTCNYPCHTIQHYSRLYSFTRTHNKNKIIWNLNYNQLFYKIVCNLTRVKKRSTIPRPTQITNCNARQRSPCF